MGEYQKANAQLVVEVNKLQEARRAEMTRLKEAEARRAEEVGEYQKANAQLVVEANKLQEEAARQREEVSKVTIQVEEGNARLHGEAARWEEADDCQQQVIARYEASTAQVLLDQIRLD